MTLLTLPQRGQQLRDAGFTGTPLVVMLAVESAESGETIDGIRYVNTAAVNDRDADPPKWGPSVGSPQVRTLLPSHPDLARYPWRDRSRLEGDPEFQAYAAWQIYHVEFGDTFDAWSVYTEPPQPYRDWVTHAEQAVAQLSGTGVSTPSVQTPPGVTVTVGNETASPTVSLIPAQTVFSPTALRLEGESLASYARPLFAQMVRSVNEPSYIVVELDDAKRALWRSDLIAQRSRFTIDGIVWELSARSKAGDRVRLTFTDAAAMAYIRDVSGHEAQKGLTGTRGEFLARLARRVQWVPFDIEGGDTTYVDLEWDPAETGETLWTAMSRIAREVNWRCCTVANRLLIGSDEWLMSRTIPVRLTEDTPGIDTIDPRAQVGVPAQTATIQAHTRLWGLPPTMAIELEGMGPDDGVWMITEVRRSPDSRLTTASIVRPQAELPEVAIQNDLYDTNPAKPEEVTAGGEIVPGKISSRGLQWPNAGNIGSEFGACRTGLSCEGSCCRRHEGVDIFTDRGTPIYACADGTVASAHGPPDAATAGYGYWVYIDHADGLQTRYCHMDRVEVTRGQKVARGQRIGTVGKTGNARTTPPHNHFEVRANGVPRNPRDYLPER